MTYETWRSASLCICVLLRIRLAENERRRKFNVLAMESISYKILLQSVSFLSSIVRVKHLSEGSTSTVSLETNSSMDSGYSLNELVKVRHERKEMIELAKGRQIGSEYNFTVVIILSSANRGVN